MTCRGSSDHWANYEGEGDGDGWSGVAASKLTLIFECLVLSTFRNRVIM